MLTLVERRFKGPGTGAGGGDLSLALLFLLFVSNVDVFSADYENAASSFAKINICFSPTTLGCIRYALNDEAFTEMSHVVDAAVSKRYS